MKKILVIILIILRIFYVQIKKFKRKIYNLNYWKEKNYYHHQKLLNFIEEIKPYLEKHNIIYWVHAGTLLGMTRHNDIIPWDDDIDFGFLYNKNIKNFINELIKDKKFIVKKDFFGFKIINPIDDIFIDMFKFIIKDNKIIQTKKSEKIWPSENYFYKELFPLKLNKFNRIYLPCPNKSNKICRRVFGKKYKKYFHFHLPHLFKFHIEKIYKEILDSIFLYIFYKINKNFRINKLKFIKTHEDL